MNDATHGCYDIGMQDLSQEDWEKHEIHFQKTYNTMEEILKTLKMPVWEKFLAVERETKQVTQFDQ